MPGPVSLAVFSTVPCLAVKIIQPRLQVSYEAVLSGTDALVEDFIITDADLVGDIIEVSCTDVSY